MNMYARMASGNGADKPAKKPEKKKSNDAPMPLRPHAPNVASPQAIHGELALGRPTELIRRAVKQVGKENTNYRLTAEEKEAMSDIVYAFKKQGIRTSENEIIRIALNSLMNDYQEKGKDSTLVTVLESLNA